MVLSGIEVSSLVAHVRNPSQSYLDGSEPTEGRISRKDPV